jgi:hypothetical protein
VFEHESSLGNNQRSASSPTSPVSESESNGESFELSSAMQRAQDIIVATERTHHLAERVRKLSHHRILALQREDFALPAPQHSDNQQQSPSPSPQRSEGSCEKYSRRRVRPVLSPSRGVGDSKSGTVLFSELDLEEIQSPMHSSDNNQFHEYCPRHQRQHALTNRGAGSNK